MLSNPSQLDRIFHALADRNRRFMLKCLTARPASVTELASKVALTMPAVLQHLQVLEKSRLIQSEKVGRVRTYQIDVQGLAAAEKWVRDRRASLQRHDTQGWA